MRLTQFWLKICLLHLPLLTIGQDFEWGKSIDVIPFNWAIDDQENVIWSGYFNVNTNISTDTANPVWIRPNLYYYGGFLSKYDTSGNLIWHIALTANDEVSLWWFEVDNNGDIIVTGRARDTTDLDPSSGTALIYPQNGIYFIAKYSSNGNYLWSFNSHALFVVEDVNNNGDIVCGGEAYVKTDIDPGLDTFFVGPKNPSNFQAFTATFDRNGNFIWGMGLAEGSGPNHGQMRFDQHGNIYLVNGSFYDSLDFDPGPDTHLLVSPLPSGYKARFIASYDSTGKLRFAKHFWNPSGNVFTEYRRNMLYISSQNSDTIDLDFNSGQILRQPFGTPKMLVVAQYDTGGNYLNDFQLNLPAYCLSSISVDRIGEVAFGGYFTGSMDMDPSPNLHVLNTFFTSSGHEEIFMAKYTRDFQMKWAHKLGANGRDVMSQNMLSDMSNNVYVMGETATDIDWNVHSAVNIVQTNQPCNCAMVKYGKMHPVDTAVNRMLCPGDSMKIEDYWVHSAGVYIDTLVARNGADSIIEITLTMDTIRTNVLYDSICEGGSRWFYGKLYTDTGIYIITLQTSRGCDSIIELHLGQRPAPTSSLPDVLEFCDNDSIHISIYDTSLISYSWEDNSRNSFWDGIFKKGQTDTLMWVKVRGTNGCTTQDTVYLKHNGLTKSNFNILSKSNYEISYQAAIHESTDAWRWNFGDNSLHTGDTIVKHTYPSNGTYFCCLRFENECRFDSVCLATLINVGIYENNLSGLKVYPNPASDEIIVNLESFNSSSCRIEIIGELGNKVFEELLEITASGLIKINSRPFQSGIYFLRIQIDNLIFTEKLIIKG